MIMYNCCTQACVYLGGLTCVCVDVVVLVANGPVCECACLCVRSPGACLCGAIGCLVSLSPVVLPSTPHSVTATDGAGGRNRSRERHRPEQVGIRGGERQRD